MNSFQRLSNEISFSVKRVPGVQSISIVLLIPGGSAIDPDEQCGQASLLSEMLPRGAGSRDARELIEFQDSLGMEREVDFSSESISFSAIILSEKLPQALELIRDVALHPRLDPNELNPSRDLCLQSIESIEDSPVESLFLELSRGFLSPPYNRSSKGTIEGIKNVTVEDLRKAVDAFSPANAILCIAGNCDDDSCSALAESVFSEWKKTTPVPLPTLDHHNEFHTHILKESSAQVQIGIAIPSIPVTHPDYPKIVLMISALSSGMSGRLFVEVREKRGLVYSVKAMYSPLAGCGNIYLYAGTTPERASETIDVLNTEMARLSQGLTEDELNRAKIQIKSTVIMSLESPRARVGMMASDLFRLGRVRSPEEIIENIEKVTLKEMNLFLENQSMESAALVTLGPEWQK